ARAEITDVQHATEVDFRVAVTTVDPVPDIHRAAQDVDVVGGAAGDVQDAIDVRIVDFAALLNDQRACALHSVSLVNLTGDDIRETENRLSIHLETSFLKLHKPGTHHHGACIWWGLGRGRRESRSYTNLTFAKGSDRLDAGPIWC